MTPSFFLYAGFLLFLVSCIFPVDLMSCYCTTLCHCTHLGTGLQPATSSHSNHKLHLGQPSCHPKCTQVRHSRRRVHPRLSPSHIHHQQWWCQWWACWSLPLNCQPATAAATTDTSWTPASRQPTLTARKPTSPPFCPTELPVGGESATKSSLLWQPNGQQHQSDECNAGSTWICPAHRSWLH